MQKDKIKKYLVCLNGGSGVIYQPADIAYTYILTCDHVFRDIALPAYNNLVHIQRYDEESDAFVEVQPFQLITGTNYFPHGTKDVAILKISKLPGAADLLRLDDFDRYSKRVSLYGFPETRRMEANYLDKIREDFDLNIGAEKGNGKREAKIPDNADYDELVGQSGGGLFCLEGNYIGLLGIQNRVPTREESMGRIEFTPLVSFDEIITASGNALESIYPSYLKNFSFLLSDIFNIPTGMRSREVGEAITKILCAKAKLVAESDLTPRKIREYLKEKLLLINGQEKEDLDKRKIWSVWLELLTILNIAKEKSHTSTDCDSLFSKVRLFYSDINEDFWVNHLSDLVKTDFSGLEKDGLVVVASNVSAVDNIHVLHPTNIPGNIRQLRKEHEDHQMEMNIDNANDFPFDKFRFANISAFKDDPVLNRYGEFAGMKIGEVLTHLNLLYVQLIT
jgi:hypothetical protein